MNVDVLPSVVKLDGLPLVVNNDGLPSVVNINVGVAIVEKTCATYDPPANADPIDPKFVKLSIYASTVLWNDHDVLHPLAVNLKSNQSPFVSACEGSRV